MPTISFSLKDLQQLSKKKVRMEELIDLAHYVKGELENYDKKTGEVTFSLDDTNLPYLWSIEGIARLYRGLWGKQKGIPTLPLKKSDYVIKVDRQVEKVRPYIVAFVAKGEALNDYGLKQLIQLQEKYCESYGRKRKKVSIGIYTPRHIAWPVHYTVTKPTEHAFVPLQETKKMTPEKILQSHPKGREYGGILAGKKQFPLLKDDKGTVLSLPPIINSDTAGKVEVGDTEFLFEATGDDERALNLSAAIFAQALTERGYTIYSVTLQQGNQKKVTPFLHKQTIKITKEEVTELLGLQLSESEIKQLLEKAGFNYQRGTVSIPHYRDDIMHPADVIEDIAIMYGFHNIQSLELKQYTVGQPLPHVQFYDQLRETLVGMGYQEIMNQLLTNKALLYTSMQLKEEESIEIENYSSEKYTVVRSWILPQLVEVLAKSKHADYPQYIFEQGTVTGREKQRITETEKIAAVIAKADANFGDAKQAVETLCRPFGMEVMLKAKKHASFIEGRCAEVIIKKEVVGILGEVHPQVLENFGIDMPVVGFELDAAKLLPYMQ